MRYSAQYAEELADSWIMGNISYVLEEIMRARKKVDAVALAVRVASYLAEQDEPIVYHSFVRRITDAALD